MISLLILCINSKTESIADLSGIHTFMLKKYLPKVGEYQIDVKTITMPLDEYRSLGTYDLCISAPICGVRKMQKGIIEILRTKVRYGVLTLCEVSEMKGEEDVLLYMLGAPTEGCRRVFWGADFELLKPMKPVDKIVILVDHPYYGKKSSTVWKGDRSQMLIDSLIEYRKKDPRIVIKQLCTGGAVTIGDHYTISPTYKRTSVDFRRIYQYYNEAHIFIPTHKESFGFTIVECAAAGALIAYPSPGYIRQELTDLLHSVPLGDCNKIQWDKIISQINIDKSIENAQVFSYTNLAKEVNDIIKEKKGS